MSIVIDNHYRLLLLGAVIVTNSIIGCTEFKLGTKAHEGIDYHNDEEQQ